MVADTARSAAKDIFQHSAGAVSRRMPVIELHVTATVTHFERAAIVGR